MSTDRMDWPTDTDWHKLVPLERMTYAAQLVVEARKRAFPDRNMLSSNESAALHYLVLALRGLGYEITSKADIQLRLVKAPVPEARVRP